MGTARAHSARASAPDIGRPHLWGTCQCQEMLERLCTHCPCSSQSSPVSGGGPGQPTASLMGDWGRDTHLTLLPPPALRPPTRAEDTGVTDVVRAAQPLRVQRRGMGKWVWKNRRRFQHIALLNEPPFPVSSQCVFLPIVPLVQLRLVSVFLAKSR